MKRFLIVLAGTVAITAMCLSIINGARFSSALWRGGVVFGGAFLIGLAAAVISVMAWISSQSTAQVAENRNTPATQAAQTRESETE